MIISVPGSDGCGRTLFRIRVDETANQNDSRILDDLIPGWVYDLRVKVNFLIISPCFLLEYAIQSNLLTVPLQNEMPKFTKIAFYIEPYAEDPAPKSR